MISLKNLCSTVSDDDIKLFCLSHLLTGNGGRIVIIIDENDRFLHIMKEVKNALLMSHQIGMCSEEPKIYLNHRIIEVGENSIMFCSKSTAIVHLRGYRLADIMFTSAGQLDDLEVLFSLRTQIS